MFIVCDQITTPDTSGYFRNSQLQQIVHCKVMKVKLSHSYVGGISLKYENSRYQCIFETEITRALRICIFFVKSCSNSTKKSLKKQLKSASLGLKRVCKKIIEIMGIQILIQMSFFQILALVCKAYQWYGSLTRAKILKKLVLIEYLNNKRLNTFPGQQKVQCSNRRETSEPDDYRSGQCSIVVIWPLKHFLSGSEAHFYNVNQCFALPSETQF